MIKKGFVYILSNKRNGTLYIGVTNNFVRRILEHKNDLKEGFTKKYRVHILVYYEEYPSIKEAIVREKNMKLWKREWKIRRIEEFNPTWRDLFKDFL